MKHIDAIDTANKQIKSRKKLAHLQNKSCHMQYAPVRHTVTLPSNLRAAGYYSI